MEALTRICCVAVAAAVAAGCDPNAGTSEDDLFVVGGTLHDFGAVERNGEGLDHVFEIENRGSRVLEIDEVRQSCTCLSAEVEPRILRPGGTSRIRVSLDARLVTGSREATVAVRFADDLEPPLVLKTRAFFVSEYSVRLAPAIWSIAEHEADGENTIRKTFTVTEFVSAQDVDRSELWSTSIVPRSSRLRVDAIGEWTPRGWRPNGFARQARVTLSFELPEESWSDEQLRLEFRHSRGPQSAQSEKATALLFVRTL